MNRPPDDRFHNTKTGRFVADSEATKEETTLVDHERETPWLKEWTRLGREMERNPILLDTLTVHAVIHAQVLK